MLIKNKTYKIVDCHAINAKNNKTFYIVTVFCNVGYVIDMFSDAETYEYIKDDYEELRDLENYIDERYDKTSRKVVILLFNEKCIAF